MADLKAPFIYISLKRNKQKNSNTPSSLLSILVQDFIFFFLLL
jgi:hypothetical protein